ncbi:MAG: hypothetical protein WAT39_22170 [Planctomycetota bacterium]
MTALPATALPSRERVLRALFWKLLFRGRSAFAAAAHRRKKQWSLGWTLLAYALLGLLPALSAFVLDPLAFASSLHATTLLFASLTLASSAGTMLFVREEAEILLHRPVRAEEMLRAKCAVLVAFALLLALALNAAGLVTGFWNRGNAWWFPVAHALTTVLVMVFSAAAIVLVYNVCLRWFGRERFENLLTLVQSALAIVMIVGVQLGPRLLTLDQGRGLDLSAWWATLLPPVWFGALDALLCATAPLAQVWLPGAIGVGATLLLAWLAFVRLGSAYGQGLLALNEASPGADRPRTRWLGALPRFGPLRWWLRDPVERHAFLLTTAYLVRDRETKLKLYPGLAPLIVMPLVMALGPGRRGDGPGVFLDTIALAYATIVPIQALMLLRRSEHWRAAELFQVAPVAHWTPLFHGARKAVLCWLALPSLAVVAAILAAIRGTPMPFAMALPAFVAVLVGSTVPGLVATWLPLSQPNSDVRDPALGCLVFGAVIGAAMALGMLGAWMHQLGWFWPFLALAVALGLALQATFTASMRTRRWRPSRE